MKKNEHWMICLERLGACDKGLKWAEQYPNVGAAWRACTNVRWLYWLTWQLGDRNCRLRTIEVFGCWMGNVNPDYFRSAFPSPTVRDLRRAVVGKSSPWVASRRRKVL